MNSEQINGDPAPARPQLRRPRCERMLAGVGAAIADYLAVDVLIVRIALVVLTFCGGLGIPLYLAGWLLIPEEGEDHSVAEQLIGDFRHL